MKNRIQTIE